MDRELLKKIVEGVQGLPVGVTRLAGYMNLSEKSVYYWKAPNRVTDVYANRIINELLAKKYDKRDRDIKTTITSIVGVNNGKKAQHQAM